MHLRKLQGEGLGTTAGSGRLGTETPGKFSWQAADGFWEIGTFHI